MKNKIIKLMLAVTVAFSFFACDVEGNNEEIVKIPNIVDIAKADADLSSLVQALTITNLAPTYSAPGSYTVFAPSNAAFTAAGVTPTVLEALTKAIADSKLPAPSTIPLPAATSAQIAGLKLTLQYHVLGIGAKSEDLLLNPNLNINGYSRTLGFYKVRASSTSGANLSMFIDNIGSDVVINGGVANGGSKIATANINASNGIIHKVGNVLALPTVVNHVIANPKLFSTLLTILSGNATTPGTYGDQSAVLGAFVAATGESDSASAVTIYAPVNSAFTTATATGGFLTNPTFFGTPALIATNVTKVLKYHYQAKQFPAGTATSFSSATALDDQDVTTNLTQKFRLLRGTLKIVELPLVTTIPAAKATVLNIQGTNGVIFAIDRVLQPVL